ncbi:MAG: hypothetical protein ABUT20_66485 [Bacteroidota bacterium]
MKGRYITTQLMLACLSQSKAIKRDIHAELQETVNERNEVIKKMQDAVRKTELIRMYLHYSNVA